MSTQSTWTQVDFSMGQVTETAVRRTDNALMRRACRTAKNHIPLVSGAVEHRAGRKLQFQSGYRVDEVLMPGSLRFKLDWQNAMLRVRDSASIVVATFTGLPWSNATIPQIRWALFSTEIVITFPGMRPRVVTYDATANSWSIANFAFEIGVDGYTRQPYYRFPNTKNITLQPSARTGTVNLVFSDDVLLPAHVGVTFRYGNEEMTIATVVDPQHGTATVLRKLPPSGSFTTSVDGTFEGAVDGFNVGDIIEGETSGCKAQVTDITGNVISFVVLKNFAGFTEILGRVADTGDGHPQSEYIVSPRSKTLMVIGSAVYNLDPEPSTIWDEALMSVARSWPASCSVDARRLIFCQFPSLGNGIAWSEIGSYNSFLVGADAANAMVEIVPGEAQVYDVVGGNDEFVLAGAGSYWIPISTDNPLKPGSVEFRQLGPEGAANMAPVATSEGVVYTNAARSRIMAIIGTGQTARPYVTKDISLYHSDIVKTPVCMAVSSGEGTDPERYVYVVNADGSIIIGRYDVSEDAIGWFPWTGSGLTKWVSAKAATPVFTTLYGSRIYAETLDADAILDGELPAIDPPDDLAPSGSHGPFYVYRDQTVSLVRNGRQIGTRAINSNGDVVWIDIDEDRSTDTLLAGFAFDSLLEPFVPNLPEGAMQHQRMRRRKIGRASVTVQNSTGFGAGSATLRTVPTDDVGDDRTAPPVRRARTYTFRPQGRSYDPRFYVVKDWPGPLRVVEISMEVSI